MKTLLLAGMAVLALTSRAAAQSGPDVDRPLVAGDWITACDATRKCGAFSLPEAGPLETPADLFIRITRDYPPGSETLLKLELKDEYGPFPDNAEVRVLIDGQESLDRRGLVSGALSLEGMDAVTLLTQMHGGMRLSIADDEGGLLASTSLAGLQDVLARMDVKQRRDGTGEALILRGPAIADWSRVGLFTPGPTIRVAERGALAGPTTPKAALLARLRASVSCPQHMTARLDEATTLLLIIPECGAYNREGILALVNEQGDIAPAPFEGFNLGGERNIVTAEPGGEVILTDPYWEHSDGVLVVERKDRAYGDCGDRQEYVWDTVGKRFRLVSYASMPACRGIREFIVTYEAETAMLPSEPRLEALDCGTEITGLDWGVCWDADLRQLALRIEAKQQELHRTLGPGAGDALIADWRMQLDDLRRSIGHRWLDSAEDDVEETLKWRLRFLSLISSREGLVGHWRNHAASIEVHSNGGETAFVVTSEGCGVTMAAGQPPMLEAVGDMLRLTVRRPDFERAYPSLVGCFNPGRSESVVDGIYFPLTASDD